MSGKKSNSNSNSNNRRSRSRRRKGGGSKKASFDPGDFWGDAAKLPQEEGLIRITPDPAAMVRSLGRPPLSGHYNAAEHYFAAVYERSVTLASALAAAGDLLEPDELAGEG